MQITVIDAQGGGMGKNLVKLLKDRMPGIRIIAAGTNALATAAMLKAGADIGATGENAVIYNCENADIIIAPIGLMIPNAMYGEISEAMSLAFGKSRAKKILIPVRQEHVYIAGVTERTMVQNMEEAAAQARLYIEEAGEEKRR